MHVLVTGGAGYIGSHTIIELINNKHKVTVVDNLSNSSLESIKRIKKITTVDFDFYTFDIQNKKALDTLFKKSNFDAVIHFAGYKSVGESVKYPLKYYTNNLDSTIVLLECMSKFNVKKIVFSSSATVYGDPESLPLTEISRTGIGITNPYGQTKYMLEQILKDTVTADSTNEVTILRYFNPIGAHESGLIGEDPNGIPNNLLPYISQVAVGKLKSVTVFGSDYNTADGTGVRDYIHVLDLAKGHVCALSHSKPGSNIYNLGTGKGTSVLELIDAFSKASGQPIPYTISERRPGDIDSCYADAKKALHELNWKAILSIEDACRDTWRWQTHDPNGYAKN